MGHAHFKVKIESEMTRKELTLQIAQEMGRNAAKELFDKYPDLYTNALIGAADICVQHMTRVAGDAWEQGRRSWFSEIGELDESDILEPDEEPDQVFTSLSNFLVARGLKAGEGDKNG